MTFRVSEVYASVQGEGPNTGRTTVFVRFGGCNLRCPGWPCDTQHAIDPAYRDEWERSSVADLLERVRSTAQLAGARTITLTGGEPFLQQRGDLEQFVGGLRSDGLRVEAFTNGTLEYPHWAVRSVAMIMDWKLPGSGEDPANPMRLKNLEKLRASTHVALPHAVKFVCKDFADLHMAQTLWEIHLQDTGVRTYYGRVWDGEITNAELVEFVMKERLPWFLNVQLHNYIWDPQERGR